MKSIRPFIVAFTLVAGACTSRPATAPAPAPSTTPAVMAPVNITEAPRNWMLLDPGTDHVYGISLLRAERELLASKRPQRTVIVAVIDNGVDTSHTAIRPHLW